MKPFKRVVIALVAALACAGVYGALRNLPAASGCNFYAECPDTVETAQPSTTSLAATPSRAAVETARK